MTALDEIKSDRKGGIVEIYMTPREVRRILRAGGAIFIKRAATARTMLTLVS